MTDNGRVGAGTTRSAVWGGADIAEKEEGVAAREKVREWACDFVGGLEGGSVSVCVASE